MGLFFMYPGNFNPHSFKNFTPAVEHLTLLQAMYGEKHRHYHDIRHIYFLLNKLKEFIHNNDEIERNHFQIYSSVVIAIWWHDAFYTPYGGGNGFNEEQSAALMNKAYDSPTLIGQFDHTAQQWAHTAILATAEHLTELQFAKQSGVVDEYSPQVQVTRILLDVDMAGFAEPMDIFNENSRNVLKEYEGLGIPMRQMLKNRVKFLTKLLEKKRIYYTNYFYNKYETVARFNIEESIRATESLLGESR